VAAFPKLPANLMGERMVEAISSARGRHWNNGLYSEDDYIAGQSIRVGEGWCEPEDSFTWAQLKGAGLAFSISNPNGDRLSIYVAFCASPPCVGSDLIIESQSGQVVRQKIRDRRGHFVIHGLKPNSTFENENYFLRLTINGPSDLSEKLIEIDKRSPAVGLVRLAVVSEADIITRLRIVEHISLMS
jgi:hypothetical protein